MTPSGRKLARKVSTSLATVGAGQSFRSVPKEATHCLRRTNTQWTIFPDDDKQPGPPRPNSDPYQDPSAEAHHADNARHRHSPPWRLAAPHACHTATPTTGIAAPNLILSGLCCRPMPNAAIPTVRTTTPLCRGHHRRHPHHKTPPHCHHRLGMCCCRRGHEDCGSPTTMVRISSRPLVTGEKWRPSPTPHDAVREDDQI
jgi:hypothetical protein